MHTLLTVHRVSKPKGAALPLHAHEHAQLTFAASGMVQVHTDAGIWLVPPQLTAWIPSGISHRLDILTDAELWMMHWQPAAIEAWAPSTFPHRAFVSKVTPLMRALLATAIEIDIRSEKASLLARLMLLELDAMTDAPTYLPLPTSAVAKRVADIALADYRNHLDLAELASRAATSARTASRLFPVETGMTLKAWRQRARIVRTMEQLAQGRAIAHVASEAGFSSTAAFCHAFRQVTDMTPGAFIEDPKHLNPRSQIADSSHGNASGA